MRQSGTIHVLNSCHYILKLVDVVYPCPPPPPSLPRMCQPSSLQPFLVWHLHVCVIQQPCHFGSCCDNFYIFCSGFEDPCPDYRLVADGVSDLAAEVQKSLKLGVNLGCRFSLRFRTDVFNFLFKGTGSVPPTGRGRFFELEDFDNFYFPTDWYIVYDKLGNGCKVVFPVRLESKTKFTSHIKKFAAKTDIQGNKV